MNTKDIFKDPSIIIVVIYESRNIVRGTWQQNAPTQFPTLLNF